jgi:hypothetical protein
MPSQAAVAKKRVFTAFPTMASVDPDRPSMQEAKAPEKMLKVCFPKSFVSALNK